MYSYITLWLELKCSSHSVSAEIGSIWASTEFGSRTNSLPFMKSKMICFYIVDTTKTFVQVYARWFLFVPLNSILLSAPASWRMDMISRQWRETGKRSEEGRSEKSGFGSLISEPPWAGCIPQLKVTAPLKEAKSTEPSPFETQWLLLPVVQLGVEITTPRLLHSPCIC